MTNNPLPKFTVENIGRAGFDTFARPAINDVTAGARYYKNMPQSIARSVAQSFADRFNIVRGIKNWTYDNPVGAKLHEFAYNLSSQREAAVGGFVNAAANPAGYSNPAGGPPRTNYGGASATDGTPPDPNEVTKDDIKQTRDTLRNTLTDIIKELREIKLDLKEINLNSIKNNTSLRELVTIFKSDKFKQAESSIESSLNRDTTSEREIESPQKSWLDKMLGLLQLGAFGIVNSLSGLFGRIAASLKSLRIAQLLSPISTAVGQFFRSIAATLKPITMAIQKLAEPVLKALAPIGRALAPLAEMAGPLLKLAPELARFGRAIPVIGEFLIVAFALVDGIKGFVKGFKGKEGNLLEKTINGLVEGVKGVFNGIIEPFKLLADFILDLMDKIPGFKKFREGVAEHPVTRAVTATGRAIGGATKAVVGAGQRALEGLGTAVHEGLGSVSKKYESENRGAATISSGRGDPGGKSYGEYQLSLKTGTLKQYVEQSEYASTFRGSKLGSSEFDAKWRKLARTDPNFAQSQHDFIKRTHFEPALKVAAQMGYDVDDRRVQEAVWSMSVQHSRQGVVKILKAAKATPGWGSMNSDQRIHALYDARSNYTDSVLSKSEPETARSVRDRYDRERVDVLKLPIAQMPSYKQTDILANARQTTTAASNQTSVNMNNSPTNVTNINNNTRVALRAPNAPITYDRSALDSPMRL